MAPVGASFTLLMCYSESVLRFKGLSLWLRGKEPSSNAGDEGLIPGLGRSLGEGNGNPLQFLPGKSHGQRNLVGFSLWAWKRVRQGLVTKQQQQHTKAQGLLEVKLTTILDQFMSYPVAMPFFFLKVMLCSLPISIRPWGYVWILYQLLTISGSL